MLGPFRIRNARRPVSPPLHPRASYARSSTKDLIVSLTGNDYDRTIEDNPDSKLKYVDEDDGETVTVSVLT